MPRPRNIARVDIRLVLCQIQANSTGLACKPDLEHTTDSVCCAVLLLAQLELPSSMAGGKCDG